MRYVTRGRDTFGFLRREPGIHEEADVRFVRTADDRLFALVDGRRREFPMPEIFEGAGFSGATSSRSTPPSSLRFTEDQPVSRWES